MEEKLAESIKIKMQKFGKLKENNVKFNPELQYDLITEIIWKKAFIPELSIKYSKSEREINKILHKFGLSNSLFRTTINVRKIKFLRRIILRFQDIFNFDGKNISELKGSIFQYLKKNMTTNRLKVADYKTILIGLLESNKLKDLPINLKEELKKFVIPAKFSICKLILDHIYNEFLLIYKDQIDKMEKTPKTSKEEITDEDIDKDIISADIEGTSLTKDQMEDLTKEFNELNIKYNNAEALSDSLMLQIDDMKQEISQLTKNSLADTEINLFRDFNTIENNFILNSFAHSIQTLNELNKEKWEPDRPELTSVMFFFELLEEFFKRRGLKTKYKIGEKIKLSYNTIDEFDYEGTEFSEAKDKKNVIVQYPAWYFKKTLISKAKVVELKKKKV